MIIRLMIIYHLQRANNMASLQPKNLNQLILILLTCSPSEMCTALPASISDMTTTSTFPVIVGTVVEVNCKPGHTLAGDNTIICIKGTSFTIKQRPTCTIGLFSAEIFNRRSDQSRSLYALIVLPYKGNNAAFLKIKCFVPASLRYCQDYYYVFLAQ